MWEKGKTLKENCQKCETSQCDTKSFYPDFCTAGLEKKYLADI